MTACDRFESSDLELYFYGELDAVERARVELHVRDCAGCRQGLDDLHAIQRALASRPAVSAPPAGDWSGFMRRLDSAVAPLERGTPVHAMTEPGAGRRSVRSALALAALLALVTIAVMTVARTRPAPAPPVASTALPPAPSASAADGSPDRSLREVSAEHLERSKLVILGLATRDPRQTRSADWQYERRLAGTLLTDTRLYRMQAQDRGLTDVARVMRDLETVLIETSMSEDADREALERVQRLIARRDLVVKMQVVAANSAGI